MKFKAAPMIDFQISCRVVYDGYFKFLGIWLGHTEFRFMSNKYFVRKQESFKQQLINISERIVGEQQKKIPGLEAEIRVLEVRLAELKDKAVVTVQ